MKSHGIGRRAAIGTLVGALTLGGVAGGQVSANGPGNGNGGGGSRRRVGVGRTYASIADAIADASPGDTIDIDAGTYEEDSLVIDGLDRLTLRGAGSDDVQIIRATGSRGLTVTDADDVTLRGFTLRDTPSGAFGLKLQYADGLTLRDVRAENNGRTGIDLNTTDNATLRDVTAVGNEGAGIAIRNANDIRVQNAKTRENAWGGIALWAVGPDEVLKNVRIAGSHFAAQPVGIYTEHDGEFANIVAHNNTFVDTGVGVRNSGAPMEVRNSKFSLSGDLVDAQHRYVMFTEGATGRITGNRGSGAHRIGIFVHGEGTDAFVHGNEIVGIDPRSRRNTQNGIQISQGATAIVRNNRIEQHAYIPRPGGTGILVNDTSGVTVERNTVRDCQIGIAIAAFFEDEAAENHIHGNVVRESILGISLQAITDRGEDTAIVRDNQITDNVLNSRNEGWLGLSEIRVAPGTAIIEDNAYDRNKIHGFDDAFYAIDQDDVDRTVVTPANQ